MGLAENLELAKKVVKEIKETVVSSDDIISSIELPIMRLDSIAEYIEKFGLVKISEKMQHAQFSSQVRDGLMKDEFAALQHSGKKHLISTLYVAVTMMGIGECADTSNLATMLLCLKGCTDPLNLIVLEGKKPDGSIFGHVMVIIGKTDPISSTEKALLGINAFLQLDNECVFIDPLLGLFGQANKIHHISDEMAYLSTYSINRIQEIQTIHNPTAFRATAEQICADAKAISQKWSQTIAPYPKPVRKPIHTEVAKTDKPITMQQDSSTALAELGMFSDPNAALLKRLAPFKSDPTTKNAFESINKGFYAQAIRRICTGDNHNSHRMLAILLEFKKELKINIDEQAGDKQQTALHITALRNNHIAYELLLSANADPSIRNTEGKIAGDYITPKPTLNRLSE